MLVCRCEEVTVGEIKAAIRQGARDVTGIKRRTRSGMGLCQGRTCEKLVQQIL
ncbi:MAG: (2Fe-2S)-binding protein, partial [Sporomusa sp.]